MNEDKIRCIDCGEVTCNGIETRIDRSFVKLPRGVKAVVCTLCHAKRWDNIHLPIADLLTHATTVNLT